MKKLLQLLCAALTWANSASAIDVTLADFNNLPTTYGTLTTTTFATNDASGMAGLTLTAADVTLGSKYVNANYGNCLSITTSDTLSHTITLRAPSGYTITGYSIGASANTANNKHVLKAAIGDSVIVNSFGYENGFNYLTVSEIETPAASFTIKTQNGGNTLYIAYFTVFLEEKRDYVTSITSGHYYRLHSYYPSLSMTAASSRVNSIANNENSYAQLWKIVKSGDQYTLQNVLTEEYIQSHPNTSVQWTTGSSSSSGKFTVNTKPVEGETWFSFSDKSYSWYGLHTAASQDYAVVGWHYEADASYWRLEEVTLTSGQLAELEEIRQVTNQDYTSDLQTFFSDYACTTLKAAYASLSDDALRSAMSHLPSTLREMAVCVKNDAWNADATWNRYEKDFRIHDYEIYSDCDKWSSITGIGPFAHLFNPTGIQAQAGEFIYIFVDSDVQDSDATLQAELVAGTNRTGDCVTLQRGYNAIYVTRDCEVFISYLLTNTSKSCNDYPTIKVHIEGATCNGCFDIHRGHTNDDWAWLSANMFKNKYLHVKGESVLLNVLKDEVINESNATGVMKIWDFVFDTEESLAGCDQWKSSGKYKMMINCFRNENGGYPHWGSGHGTSHPVLNSSNLFSYSALANIGDKGGVLWELTHEMGHGHQAPINCAGMTEESNNSLSQIVNLLAKDSGLFESTRSSRAQGVKEMLAYFNEDTRASWIDYAGQRINYGLWMANRFYFQLWLYFDYLGNYQPSGGNTGFSFMSALYDRLRASGISNRGSKESPAPATSDFLLVAKYAAEITQTDLSEFFEVWGFWETSVKVPNEKDDASTQTWYFSDYGDIWVQTREEYVTAVRQAMKQYTKKGGNILFIEDRGVGSTLDTYDGTATSTFGEVGYYETYTGKVVSPYDYTLRGNTVTMTGGQGAVGFKIYDADGNLIYVANTLSFTVSDAIAAGLQDGTYTVKVAQGDGLDYAMGECYDLSWATVGSVDEISNIRAYKIYCERGALGVSGTQLVATSKSEFSESLFALVSYESQFYLWSVEAHKFVNAGGDLTNVSPTPVTVTDLGNSLFMLSFGSNVINTSSGYALGLVINGWNTRDEGNQYTIEPIEAFDPTEPLAILSGGEEESYTYVTDLANLSNDKAYIITNQRATWNATDGSLGFKNYIDPDMESQLFALLQSGGRYYLYSIAEGKYLTSGNALSDEPQHIEILSTGNADFPWFFRFDEAHNINMNTGGTFINNWTTIDEGNSNAIIEVADFDPTEALDRTSVVSRLMKPWFTTNVGSLFGLSQTVCDRWAAACESLTSACTPAEYEDVITPVKAGIRRPSTGKFRIKSSGQRIGDSYLGYGTTVYGTGLRTFADSVRLTEPSLALTLTRIEGQDVAAYTITTTAGNVQAFSSLDNATLNNAYPVTADEGAVFLFDILSPGIVAISTARGQTYLHEAGSNPPGVVRWYAEALASHWSVEAITQPGDVNCDGQITIADVTALVNIILGKDEGPNAVYDHEAADVNLDGSVTIADVTALVNIILGKN